MSKDNNTNTQNSSEVGKNNQSKTEQNEGFWQKHKEKEADRKEEHKEEKQEEKHDKTVKKAEKHTEKIYDKAKEQGQKAFDREEMYHSKDWNPFRGVVAIIGILIILIAVWAIWQGIDGILGAASMPFNEHNTNYSSVQSNYAFFGGLYIGIGIAFLAVAIQFRWAQVLWFVSGIIFLGGVSRLVAMARWGAPHGLLIVLIVVELALPVALIIWYSLIEHSAKKEAQAQARIAQIKQGSNSKK